MRRRSTYLEILRLVLAYLASNELQYPRNVSTIHFFWYQLDDFFWCLIQPLLLPWSHHQSPPILSFLISVHLTWRSTTFWAVLGLQTSPWILYIFGLHWDDCEWTMCPFLPFCNIASIQNKYHKTFSLIIYRALSIIHLCTSTNYRVP